MTKRAILSVNSIVSGRKYDILTSIIAIYILSMGVVPVSFLFQLSGSIKGELRKIINNNYAGIDAFDALSLSFNYIMIDVRSF